MVYFFACKFSLISILFLCFVNYDCAISKLHHPQNSIDMNQKKCGRKWEESTLAKKTMDDLPYWIPTDKDADESDLVSNEFRNRIGDDGIEVGKSPQVLFSRVLIYGNFSEPTIEHYCCLLKDVKEKWQTKPIVLTIYERKLSTDANTDQNDMIRVKVGEYVIE